MSLWSLYKTNIIYNREFHGILRYLRKFRYFTFFVIVIWSFTVIYSNSPDNNFPIYKKLILIAIVAVYLVIAEIMLHLTRMEKVKSDNAYQKSMLLYKLSKELNQTSDYSVICDRIFAAIDHIIAIVGMKVLFDENQEGSCKEIYLYELEEIDWSMDINCETDEDSNPEFLQGIHSNAGFFVLSFGEKPKSGMLVLRASNQALQPEKYEAYLKTIAELAATSLQNAATLRRLALQSVSDSLTDLPNKRYFAYRLEETVRTCKRYRMNFVVGMLDIDHFKSINDRYGHVFGDFILKSCAQIIQQTLRGSDLIARYGGEEFGIIMPYTDLDGALKIMERVRNLVEAKVFEGEGETCQITISIGITAGQPHLGATDIVKLADRALYVAKKNGRNQVVCDKLQNGRIVRN